MVVLNGRIMNSQRSGRYECKKNGCTLLRMHCRRDWIRLLCVSDCVITVITRTTMFINNKTHDIFLMIENLHGQKYVLHNLRTWYCFKSYRIKNALKIIRSKLLIEHEITVVDRLLLIFLLLKIQKSVWKLAYRLLWDSNVVINHRNAFWIRALSMRVYSKNRKENNKIARFNEVKNE